MKETYYYRPKGVCSQQMIIDLEDGLLTNLQVIGGCNGNLKGIAALVKGKKIEEVIEALEGITCGPRNTSCPDQLAQGLKEFLAEKYQTK